MAQMRAKNDRRKSDRYPIVLPVRFKFLDGKSGNEFTGSGKTVNISSSGVLFTADQALIHGQVLELQIAWPTAIGNTALKQLVVIGPVVRYENGCAAMEIKRYEFRTLVNEISQPDSKTILPP